MTLSFLEGLNVYSMLKHETLVLTLAALERLEERLLFHMHSPLRPRKQHPEMSPTLYEYPVTVTNSKDNMSKGKFSLF